MKIRVYNQNGKVKVTKLTGVRELVMFNELQDGEMAEINIETTQFTKSIKAAIRNKKEDIK